MKNKAEEYIKTWAGIKTPDEMAEELFFSRSWVINLAAKLGVSVVLKDSLEKRDLVKFLVKKYHKTKTKSEIARLAGVPAGTVRWYAEKLGIQIKSYKRNMEKREVNSEYFDEKHDGAWLCG